MLVKNGFVEFHEGRGDSELWGSVNSLLVEADLVQAVAKLLYKLKP